MRRQADIGEQGKQLKQFRLERLEALGKGSSAQNTNVVFRI